MNVPLKKLITPPAGSKNLAAYFDHCRSRIAESQCLAPLKQEILVKLGLNCVAKNEVNTCMSQTMEVMPAYREHYSPEELFYFLLQKSHSLPELALGQWERLIPKSEEEFWKAVASGRLLEKKYLYGAEPFT
jgi:hypothetical protein